MKNIQLFFLSFLSGILLSIPWIFPAMSWVLFIAFIPLLFLEDSFKKADRFSSNFLFPFLAFLVWNLLSTWWIAYVSFSGMILISVLNSILMATAWWLAFKAEKKFGMSSGYFALIVFWITLEFLLLHWDLPWPWLTLGNGFANTVKIIQWYEYTGVLGGSVWVLLVNCLFYVFLKIIINRLYHKSIKIALAFLVVSLVPFFYSLFLYLNYTEDGPTSNVVILQPNIDPYSQKFSGMSSETQIKRLLNLTKGKISDSTNLIVTPETALPTIWEDSLDSSNKLLNPILNLITEYPKVGFIAGAITMRKFDKDEIISDDARQSENGGYYYNIFNSALFFDKTSQFQISHKSILVNGVEKMPFPKYFSFLDRYILHLGGTSGSLSTGKELELFSVKNSCQIGPIICFESVFGEFSGKLAERGANMLTVITNDGWWKSSIGNKQHFSYSRLRAIETRRSIARSANTGISGFINQRGDVLKKTEMNTYAALTSSIRLNSKVTFYAIYGDYIGRFCAALSVLIAIYVLVYFWFKWK